MGKFISDTIKYSYNDVSIVPAVISDIEHRAECNPYDDKGMLPLFTAPMDSVVNKDNYAKFIYNKITPILPRTESIDDRLDYARNGEWAAFSLQEFEDYFAKNDKFAPEAKEPIRALIDIANGHVSRLYKAVRESKKIYGDDIEIMVGNIANPETYRVCVESQVNFCRVGIGGGCGCITTSNTGIHYPQASLISEIYEIKRELIERGADEKRLTKIVADGGIRNYSGIIKALVLGADYVMIGSVFAKMLESAAIKHCNSEGWHSLPLWTKLSDIDNIHKDENGWKGTFDGKEVFLGDITAVFYGMASRAGQIAMKGEKNHTSEGIEKRLPVLYTMKTWVENMTDYLRSAMSYTGSRTLDDFRNNAKVIVISKNTYESVNK